MNNIEKKLDALIDALGFDVEEVETPVKVTSYEASKPAVMIERTLYTNSYKLTKKVRHYELTKPMIENIIGVLEGHDNDDVHILINNLEVMIDESI